VLKLAKGMWELRDERLERAIGRCADHYAGVAAVKRPHIPIKIRLAVLERQAFEDRTYPSEEERDLAREWYELRYHKFNKSEKIEYLLELLFHGMPVELDHDPALVFRRRNLKTGGYRPDANDPKYLRYVPKQHHRQKTFGRKPDAERTVTTKGSDIWLAKKFRRLEKPQKPKQKIPSRPFPKRLG